MMWVRVHIDHAQTSDDQLEFQLMMKTIQITIDEELLENVDQVVHELGETRSAFIRQALERALHRWQIYKLEAQHAAGYQRHPVAPGEFDDWGSEQHWGDA